MATAVFVHGTGVREPGFSALAGRVAAGLGAVRNGLRVVPYYWGGAHGAMFAAGGVCLPPDTGAVRSVGERPDASDEETALWATLYADPDAELVLVAAAARTPAERPPGSSVPEQRVQRLLSQLAVRGDEGVRELGPGMESAIHRLGAHPLLGAAADVLEPEDLANVLARSLAARVIADALDADAPLIPDGRTRDEVTARLAHRLGAPRTGVERGLRTKALGLVGTVASNAAVRRRRALTQAAHPAAGDVLRYLSRGEAVRADFRLLLAGLEPPVTVIGHSLGGIIALDTLVTTPLPQVRLLVTVGSQGPLLYELGSLPSLVHPQPLPAHVPDWLNLYDRRDLLGYLGASLFPGRVTDVVVDNRQPFPAAHSAYWNNSAIYRLIAERLP